MNWYLTSKNMDKEIHTCSQKESTEIHCLLTFRNMRERHMCEI